ncbi:hypothetical protein ILUMI_26319 [Ignelater luminosus]|uniref:CHK kinase-like domain-containing protein n=1 Tax=Ignelater luminosus TaxID=2038154 RepID=A0A8K0C8Q9_IGNLU|nr:hypothetical protein ILUMI_26319 [Ignelater luminosus]
MTEKEVLSVQDCKMLIKKYLQTEDYEIIEYEVVPTILDGYLKIKINLENEFRIFKTTEEVLKDSSFKEAFNDLKKLIVLFPSSKLTSEELEEHLNNLYNDGVEISKSKNNFYKVLCHGFMWNKSVIFRKHNECKLINFESVQYGPPILDVLQFIYMNTTAEVRKYYFHDLLELYYNSLKFELQNRGLDISKIMPLKEDFEVSVHYFLPLVKLQIACFRYCLSTPTDILLPDPRGRLLSDQGKETPKDRQQNLYPQYGKTSWKTEEKSSKNLIN